MSTHTLTITISAARDDVFALVADPGKLPPSAVGFAKEARQEILVKLVTRLSSFRGDASFRTWAYRVATGHLLTTKKRRMERATMQLDEFAEDLAEGFDTSYDGGGVDEGLLAEEVEVGCTQGMLLCLDREHRIAYILGEVPDPRSPGPSA